MSRSVHGILVTPSDTFSTFADFSVSPQPGVQLVAKGDEHDHFAEWVSRLASDDKLRADYDALKAGYHGKKMSEYRATQKEFISRNLRD